MSDRPGPRSVMSRPVTGEYPKCDHGFHHPPWLHSCDGCWPCPEDHHRKPPAPAVAPDSPSPAVVDPAEVSGPQNGSEHEEEVPDGRVRVWFVPSIANLEAPTVAEVNAGIKWVDLFGIDPDYSEPPLPTRLRALADADLEAAKHGSRIQRAAAKAAARAYRLAADMIEEDE